MLVDLFATRTLEDPATELTGTELASWLGTSVTANTGSTINTTTAMRTAAVYACVRILAEAISSLPLFIYERLAGGGKQRAANHPLYRLLHDLPNPYLTAMEMRENLVAHLNLWGNAYCEVVSDVSGAVRELWPLRPDNVSITEDGTGALWLVYTSSTGETNAIPYRNVWHIRAFGTDSYTGMSVISQAREAIGLAIAAEEFGAKLFANDSTPGGVLTHPGKLGKAARTNLKTGWENAHKGLDYAHRVAVLEEGVQWQQIGIPPDDAQFLETRKFQVTEIARMFRVPPHMLADLERATFSNIEHQSLEFVMHSLRPWLVRMEQSIYRDLLTKQERERYFAEHLVDGLLRGDIQSRYNAYAVARQNGWMSADDIRELENMNPLPDGQGSIYLVPLNMAPADEVGDQDEPAEEGRALPALQTRAGSTGSAAARRKIARSFRRMIEDASGRVLRREIADVVRQAEKQLIAGDVGGFLSWLESFYTEHQGFFSKNMLPVLTGLADQIQENAAAEIGQDGEWTPEVEQFVDEYTDVAAYKYAQSNLGQLRQVVREAEDGAQLEALQGRFDEWSERTPGKQAMRHSVRAANAVTRETWARGGVQTLIWATNGKNCPWCNYLSGRVVSIRQPFATKDSPLFVPGGITGANNQSLSPGRDIRHPPLHDGCDCGLRPG